MSKTYNNRGRLTADELSQQSEELNILEPFTMEELRILSEEISRIKRENPNIKKIHRLGRPENKIFENETAFTIRKNHPNEALLKRAFKRSVLFDDNGRAYIIHKIKKLDAKGESVLLDPFGGIVHKGLDKSGKEVYLDSSENPIHESISIKEAHYAAKGAFGEFRYLQDPETFEYCEGVKIQEARFLDLKSEESQSERHVGMAVGSLRRERNPEGMGISLGIPKQYDIKRRVMGKELRSILNHDRNIANSSDKKPIALEMIQDKDKPQIVLAGIFEVMKLHSMGICHRDIKEGNFIYRKEESEGSHLWQAGAIDFGSARRVNPRKWGFATIPSMGGGTPGYMDTSLTGWVWKKNVQKIDSYSLARMTFNIFNHPVSETENYTLPDGGFDREKALKKMREKGQSKEADIVAGLSHPKVSKRMTSREAFIAMAEIYPKEVYKFLNRMLETECKPISDEVDLPPYLMNNTKLQQALRELKTPVSVAPTRKSSEIVDEYLYKHKKAALLNALISAAQKYKETFEVFGLAQKINDKIAEIADRDKKKFSDSYVYDAHDFVFKMLDRGDLLQNLALELKNQSILPSAKKEIVNKVSKMVEKFLNKSHYTDLEYFNLKKNIASEVNKWKQKQGISPDKEKPLSVDRSSSTGEETPHGLYTQYEQQRHKEETRFIKNGKREKATPPDDESDHTPRSGGGRFSF